MRTAIARVSWPAVLAVTACWCVPDASAQVFNSVSYVRELHERYLGREPSADESAYWATRLQQGSSPADIHAGIVGSEAFFDQHRRDVRSWIKGAYAAVLRREPTVAELDYWQERYDRLDRDRMRWAKEFLRSSGGRLPTSAARPATSVNTDDLPDRLATTAHLLRQAVDSEIPGNSGWLVKLQASNLEWAATSGKDALARPASSAQATQVAYRNIESGIRGVQDGLAACGFSAPTSRLYLSQVTELYSAIGRNVTARPVNPVTPVSNSGIGSAGPTYEEFKRRVERLAGSSQQVVVQLRGLQVRDYYYARLLNDAESFLGQVDVVRSSVRFGDDIASLRSPLTRLQFLAAEISDQVQRGNLDARLVQSWYEATLDLGRVLELAGVSESSRPLSPPATPLTPIKSTANLHADAAAAMAQCDGFIASLAPYVFFSPNVQRMQSQLQSLRNSLDAFRRQVSSGDSRPQLQQQLGVIKSELQNVQNLWNQALSDPQLRSLPNLSDLQLAVNKLEQSFLRSP